MNFHCSRVIEENSSEVRRKWKEKVDNAINNQVSGKYTRTLICSYRDLCDCNAKMKLDYSMSTHSISLLWYSFGHSHDMPSSLNNLFATFEKLCTYTYKSQIRIWRFTYFDFINHWAKGTYRENIDCVSYYESHSLVKEMLKSYPTYSQRYWVLARKVNIRGFIGRCGFAIAFRLMDGMQGQSHNVSTW